MTTIQEAKVKPNGVLYGYARVSTVQQDLGLQTQALLNAGVPTDHIFSEKMSGKEAKNRKEWNTLKDRLESGDTVIVHKLDRLGRSMVDVMNIVEYFKERDIFLVVIDANIDTRNDEGTTAGLMTKALMTLLSLMAEMERTFIIERTKPAIEQARRNGVTFGRPKIKGPYEKAIKEFIEADGALTVPDLIRQYGNVNGKPVLTSATFFRRLKEYRAKEAAK